MPTIRIDVPGRSYAARLPETVVRVGSGEACELRLACEGVAREHCLLEPLPDGRVKLRDLQSGRPTRVNGIEAHQVALRPGDVVEIGEARILFGDEPALVAAAPPPAAGPAPAAAPARGPTPEPFLPGRAAAPRPPAPERPAAAARTSRRRVGGVLALIGAAGVLAIVLALALGPSSGEGSGRAARDLERAEALYAAQDLAGAREAFARVAADPKAGEARLTAERWLARLRQAESDATADLERVASAWQSLDLEGAGTERAILVQRHGASFGPRFDEVLRQARMRQDAWAAEQIAAARSAASTALGMRRLGDALGAWQRLRSLSTRGDVRSAASEGVAAVEKEAASDAQAALEEADRAAKDGRRNAALELLRARRQALAGTAAETLVASRLRELEAASPPPQAPAGPTPGTSPGGPAPGPETRPTPPPAPTPEVVTRAEGVLLDVEKAAGERRFDDALLLLDGLPVSELPSGALRDRLVGRRADLTLARAGLRALIADVKAHPQRYERLALTLSTPVSLTDADDEGVTGAVAGGRSKYRWGSLTAERLAAIAERLRASGADALGIASLLREAGAPEAADLHLYRAGTGGVDGATLFPVIARWRGESVPAEGYVPYEERYVTPAERERLLLLARIADLVKRLDGKDAAGRRRAVDELLAIGEPAKEPLVAALGRRREAILARLEADKSLASPKTRQRLHEELQRRRREALALIEDEQRYPYPNPDHRGQAEVEALVDRVREAWERPFLVVASWDEGAQEALALVAEVDEGLARVTPSYQPDVDALAARLSAAIDLRGYAPPDQVSLREYSLSVLAYNEKVKTTATVEERDNVRAVNEYRMMMGRRALKIHERLVRAARGHSRHMRLNNYFAHDAPDPDLRTPQLRARRQGYGGGVGENIAQGTSTGRDAFAAWFRSSGHHRNMVAAGWTEMGAGRSGGIWWTQLFGAATQLSLTEPDPLTPPGPDVVPEEEGAPAAGAPGGPRVPDERPPSDPPPQTPPGDPPPGER